MARSSTWIMWGLVVLAVGFLTSSCRGAAGSLPESGDDQTTAVISEKPSPSPTPVSEPPVERAPPSVVPSATSPPNPTSRPLPSPTVPPAISTVVVTVTAGVVTVTPISWPTPAPGVNPFTWLLIGENRAAQRPLAIKISNFPPQVRPQWGLNAADLVYEHLAEGGATRFTALFYGQRAERVGSIRSGRLIDLEIPKMYDAAFAYSGASGPVRLKFRDSPFFKRIISPDFGHGGFDRLPKEGLAFEHTLFTNTDTLHYLLDLRGENHPPALRNVMFFDRQPPSGGVRATAIEIPYGGTYAYWGFRGADGYLRWTDGEPHLDAADDSQLAFDNIVVIFAHHQETGILEDNVDGGSYSIEIQIWGEGPAVLFRDGRRYDGRWQRWDPQHMLTLVDQDGMPLPLAPGRTFFQVVPRDFDRLLVTP